MSLDVQVREISGTVVVSLAGEMDTHTARSLSERVDEFLAASSGPGGPSAPTVVVDAAELRFLDSSGIAELLRLRQRMVEANGTLTVRSATASVRRVLEITGLVEVLGLD